MRCPYCGNKVPDGSTICTSCGASLSPEVNTWLDKLTNRHIRQNDIEKDAAPYTVSESEKIGVNGAGPGNEKIRPRDNQIEITGPGNHQNEKIRIKQGEKSWSRNKQQHAYGRRSGTAVYGRRSRTMMKATVIIIVISVAAGIISALSDILPSGQDTYSEQNDYAPENNQEDYAFSYTIPDFSYSIPDFSQYESTGMGSDEEDGYDETNAADGESSSIVTVDPFDSASISYYGIGPEGSAYVSSKYENDYDYMFDFELDKDSGLSNGDIITISLTDESMSQKTQDDLLNYYNVRMDLSKTSKEVTVEGLREYASDLEQFTSQPDCDARIEDAAISDIKDLAKLFNSDSIVIDDITRTGTILQTLKDQSTAHQTITGDDGYSVYLSYNIYSQVYQVTFHAGGSTEKYSFYTTESMDDVIIEADKSYMKDRKTSEMYFLSSEDLTKFKIGSRDYAFPGYQSIDELIGAIESQDRYDYETDLEGNNS